MEALLERTMTLPIKHVAFHAESHLSHHRDACAPSWREKKRDTDRVAVLE